MAVGTIARSPSEYVPEKLGKKQWGVLYVGEENLHLIVCICKTSIDTMFGEDPFVSTALLQYRAQFN